MLCFVHVGAAVAPPQMQRTLRSSSRVLANNGGPNVQAMGKVSGAHPDVVQKRAVSNGKGPRASSRKRARLTTPPAQTANDVPDDISPSNGNHESEQVSRTPRVSAARPGGEPLRTNATLKTPGGSRLVPSTQKAEQASPTRPRNSSPPITTENLLERACRHLISIDGRLEALIEKHPCTIFSPEGLAEEVDPFQSLVSGIMSQQVSGAAAKSIKQKFINLFNDTGPESPADTQRFPKPEEIASKSIPFLLQAGLSGRKAEYIKGLAEKFCGGELSAQLLMNASDEEVLERLTAVRGLGRWSVEMFSCFSLKRLDIFSTGDLGVQ